MDRRDAISTFIGGLTGAAASDLNLWGTRDKKNRILVVIHLHVWSLPRHKVTQYIEKVKNEFCSTKPEGFHFLILPQRHYLTHVDVFSLDDQVVDLESMTNLEAKKWFEANLPKLQAIHPFNSKLNEFNSSYADDSDIIEYVKLIYGAPVFKLPDSFEERVQSIIDLGKQYVPASLLKAFVYETCRLQFVEISLFREDFPEM
jgi:hypothetical protein